MPAKKIFLIGIVLLGAIAGIYLAAPQQNTSSQQRAIQNAETISKESSFSTLMEEARKDLVLSPSTLIALTAVDGAYYDFNANDPQGGGVEILSYRNPKGLFEKIWEGQDVPDCFFVEHREVYLSESEVHVYTVPVSLAPECSEAIHKDRTRPINRILELFDSSR